MAFNQTSEYPSKVIRIDALTNSVKVVTPAGSPIRIAGFSIDEQAGALEAVIFRNNAGTQDYFIVYIASGSTQYFPIRWKIDDLEVVLGSAGNVDITFFIDNSGNIDATEV